MQFARVGLALLLVAATMAGAEAQAQAQAQTPKPMGRSLAQPPDRQAPAPNAAGPRYDPATVTTVKGTITAIDTLASMMGMPGSGVHLTLKTAKETLPVHLGPVQYLTQQKLRLVKGDAVAVHGSRVLISTVPTLLAASVVRGTDTLTLRDEAGFPKWRGMRMNARR